MQKHAEYSSLKWESGLDHARSEDDGMAQRMLAFCVSTLLLLLETLIRAHRRHDASNTCMPYVTNMLQRDSYDGMSVMTHFACTCGHNIDRSTKTGQQIQ